MSLREQLLNLSSTAPPKRVFPKIQRKFQNPDKNDEDEEKEILISGCGNSSN